MMAAYSSYLMMQTLAVDAEQGLITAKTVRLLLEMGFGAQGGVAAAGKYA